MDAVSAFEQLENLQVVDVREPAELEGGRIEGSLNIPLGELPYRLTEIDESRRVLTVCETGDRSSQAAQMLKEQGFDSENLDGGMWGWTLRRYPVINDQA
ncbi:MAG TPA: rhodanese-like domain-containing protein [Actinomycetota bacterium]|nr:rhodanese-like domain-containing protein [Actinomycetota bacterium]